MKRFPNENLKSNSFTQTDPYCKENLKVNTRQTNFQIKKRSMLQWGKKAQRKYLSKNQHLCINRIAIPWKQMGTITGSCFKVLVFVKKAKNGLT